MKEILRLHYEGKLSNRKISKALNVSHSVVNDYIKEFKNSNKEYEDIASLHTVLLRLIFLPSLCFFYLILVYFELELFKSYFYLLG